MCRVILVAALAFVVAGNAGRAQDKLKTDGFGSLSGTVTYEGAKLPVPESLVPKMMANQDKMCCLDPNAKDLEKVDMTWIIDPKTKGVANVAVWIKAPKGTYLEVHPKYTKRNDTVVIDQPHCAFLPRVSIHNPVYFDGAKLVPTGQQLHFKNSSVVAHNTRAIGHPKYNNGFNKVIAAKQMIDAQKDLAANEQINPQPLPLEIKCDLHTWMGAQLFVFDHPYYALTNEKGEFEIPFVPAGAEVTIMGWHEGSGWSLTNKGTPITIEKNKKHTFNFTVK